MLPSRKYPSLPGACSGVFSGFIVSGIALAASFAALTGTAVAGDLLRGGGFTAPQTGSSVPGTFTPPAAAEALKNAHDALARNTLAIESVTRMQNAARAIALSGGNNLGLSFPGMPSQTLPAVTNGLSTSGLNPLNQASWTGIKSVTQAENTKGQDIVTITQDLQNAVLTWTSFNVGANTTLDFNQSAGGANTPKWIALNVVEGNTIAPTQILGKINAAGQVYVIDQNGIVFGGASQINVHTLTASSLPINMFLVNQGLLDNPDEQFLFSAIPQPAGSNGTPAFTPPTYHTGADGDVIVEAGAQITAPANTANVGGRVMLVAPDVINDGVIATPDGQTILAAGLQVGIQASSDATLRGLDVYVGAVSSPDYTGPAAGTALNNGFIDVPEGDAMITGETVEQMGDIYSETSVSLSGRIDLLADYGAESNVPSSSQPGKVFPSFLYQDTGNVELGPGSVSSILPDLASTDTVVTSQFALNSVVKIEGQSVDFAANSTLLAPNANINVDAGFWFSSDNTQHLVYYSTADSSPQIYVASGALIDAAGSADVEASVAQNIIAVQLLSAQLADVPAQRSLFHGQTIYVDIRNQGTYNGVPWIGTPLADATGYAGLVPYDIGELTVNGGSVDMEAGGSVVMQKGSEVNVSGGYINYTGGEVETTKVLSDGHIYDISDAFPDMIFQGIFNGQYTENFSKYGLSETFTAPILDLETYEQGYVYGGNGGTVNITAPSMALQGTLLGQTANGPRQLQLQAQPGTLDLSFSAQNPTGDDGLTFPTYYPTPPTVYIEQSGFEPAVGAFSLNSFGDPVPILPALQKSIILSPDLTGANGFGTFSLDDSDGKVIVPDGTTWDAPAATYDNSSGGEGTSSITIFSANATVDGSIIVPGGSITVNAYDISPYQAQLDSSQNVNQNSPYNKHRGNVVLGADGSLNTSGLLIDDELDTNSPETMPEIYTGGGVSIAASNVDLNAGSLIDVSGGVYLSPTGTITYGNGGAVSLTTGRDLDEGAVLGGGLTMAGTVEGYSGATGGSFSIKAPLVRIGGPAQGKESLALAPDFFSTGGFTSFSITGLGEPGSGGDGSIAGLVIEPGTMIDAVALNSILAPVTEVGDNLVLVPTLLPEQSRSPVNLSFSASSTTNLKGQALAMGQLIVGPGAVIESDPGGTTGATISFKGDTVDLLGSVIAPAGAINVTGDPDTSNGGVWANDPNNGSGPIVTVNIGPSAYLSTAGTVVPTANAYGYNTGNVLGGGTITLSGNIAAHPGSILNVSGASAVLDLLPTIYSSLTNSSPNMFAGNALVPTLVESNGGLVNLVGGQGLFFDSTIEGNAGGSEAVGGSLIVSSNIFTASSTIPITVNEPTVEVTQNPLGFHLEAEAGSLDLIVGKNKLPLTGMGYIAADTFEESGMDFLTLEGSVSFKGPVDLFANDSLTVATAGYLYANAGVHLTAPYVELGMSFATPLSPLATSDPNTPGILYNPSSGSGKLIVTADVIDIGNLSLQGIGNADFIADNGDIQGDGTLDAAGNILMKAAQIYPPTETTFNIISYGGSVTFKSAGIQDLPLSAGGTINVYASNIIQDGDLVAPFGQINLGWDGTGTEPIDPLTGAGNQAAGSPDGLGENVPSIPIAQTVDLRRGSITSVSGIDPHTGVALIIPYGINQNGTEWIDPSGTDLTESGATPQKSVTIAGLDVTDAHGARIDIAGGGDLFAYRFVSGTEGTNDILASNNLFAILPGYQFGFAPFGEYDTSADTTSDPNAYTAGSGQSDFGYYNPNLAGALHTGMQIYLAGGGGLAAGYYTLLPARYALLQGAYLVTPQGASTIPVSSAQMQPDGSFLMSGYEFHGLDTAQTGQPLYAAFDVANGTVVKNAAEYDEFFGNAFFTLGAATNNQPKPPLPADGGHLIIGAVDTLSLEGSLEAGTGEGGSGALVDISTSNPNGILITTPGGTSATGQLVLNASSLSAFGAGSLLIGGERTVSNGETTVDVTTSEIEVDNSGSPLTGSDIILAATGNITLDNGAEIESKDKSTGGSDITVDGNGALLRVSSNPELTVTRTGVTAGNTASLTIGNDCKIIGGSVTIDSSDDTTLGTGDTIKGESLALDGGSIDLDLSGPATLSSGLVLTSAELQTLTSGATSFSLLSYQSIDIDGAGQIGTTNSTGQPQLKNLALHAGAINGFGNGDVVFAAQNIVLDNEANTTVAAGTQADTGTLEFSGNKIELGGDGVTLPSGTTFSQGDNQMNIGQYATVTLNATGGVIQSASGGFSVGGDLDTTAPVLTAAKGTTGFISAGGALSIQSAGSATVTGGAGASLTFTAASIDDDSSIVAHSGLVNMEALTGDLDLESNASIDVSGVSQTFFDVTKYTGGGNVTLTADQGSVNVFASASGVTAVNVSAPSAGGNAGTFTINAPGQGLTFLGTISGEAGAGGKGGSFLLDVGTLTSLDDIDTTLNAGGFNQSISIRDRTDATVDLDGSVTAASYTLSADEGAIDILGTINADDVAATDSLGNATSIGGSITLIAEGNLTLESGAELNASGVNYDNAGHGGSVSLETNDGLLTISGGSTINLTVSDAPSGPGATQEVAGTLYLQAPQTDIHGNILAANASPTTGVNLNIAPIAGNIVGASSIVAAGFYTQSVNTSSADIDNFESTALQNADSFVSSFLATSTPFDTLANNNASIESILQVRPGELIENTGGDLVLQNDWDLSTARFGPTEQTTNNQTVGTIAGILNLRASGNVIFNGALSDGFGDDTGSLPLDTNGNPALWLDPLLPQFTNGQSQESWSYNITAGADTAAANPLQVQTVSELAAQGDTGTVAIGQSNGFQSSSPDGTTASAVEGYYQVIRTGAGSINVSAGGDVQLLNQFATIYSAGTMVNPSSNMPGGFDVPVVTNPGNNGLQGLSYVAQYSDDGGDVDVTAGQDIIHLIGPFGSTPVLDSDMETPNNWLYRRGAVGANGQFAKTVTGDVASTTWWVDFSNFFEGIGTLGGGNVSLVAGHDVTNVDGVVATNARMPKGTPNKADLVELGGGDLLVQAGDDISGGIYYVESGDGTISAGNQILTNSARSTNYVNSTFFGALQPTQEWLPTSYFLGAGNLDVSARGDVLMGPVVNPFLLPTGVGNGTYDNSFFSTYATSDVVDVTSLGGSVTLRENANDSVDSGETPIMGIWVENQALEWGSGNVPWVESNDGIVGGLFNTAFGINAPTLEATAFSGDINIQGDLTLSPSPTGTLQLLASGAINGLQPTGQTSVLQPISASNPQVWASSHIDVSDANPSLIYSVTDPLTAAADYQVQNIDFTLLNTEFTDSGSTTGNYAVIQTQEALHGEASGGGPLHKDDPTPVRLYATGGNIADLTLFSPTETRVIASQDVTDIGLYIQNVDASDISVVSAGEDIVAYNPDSPDRVEAQAGFNEINPADADPQAGDIQIAGPGTIEVLAGRNLTMGVGSNNFDGTGVGITSIGDAANPYLPFNGASVVAAAGLGSVAVGLEGANALDYNTFMTNVLEGPSGATYFADLATTEPGSDVSSIAGFKKLTKAQQAIAALDLFYLVLRDAGRDHNLVGNPGFGNYAAATAAIAAFLPSGASPMGGDINLTSREIKTEDGGDIDIFDPSGQMIVGVDLAGTQPVDQGILTADGGNISIYTEGSVTIGTSRIFTLRGGNIIIWSQTGNIAAGASSKTVQSAPPTRVLVDPQSANVETDLAGLATGGGIGVLASVANVPAGSVDLIAPSGIIDAGDAGIRATGNLNLAAVRVLNASNIQAGGSTAGVPTVTVAAPNLGAIAAASATVGATQAGASQVANNQNQNGTNQAGSPSIINVEVLGYGGGDSETD